MATTQPTPIGRDTLRIDGPRKVTGQAQYTSDFNFPGMLYGVPVEATIANGKLVALDTAAAEKMPGVRKIFHRANIGRSFDPLRRRASSAFAWSAGPRSKTMKFVTTASTSLSSSLTLSKPRRLRLMQFERHTRKKNRMLRCISRPAMILTSCSRVMDQCHDCKVNAAILTPRLPVRPSSSTRLTERHPKRTIHSSCTPPPRCGMATS